MWDFRDVNHERKREKNFNLRNLSSLKRNSVSQRLYVRKWNGNGLYLTKNSPTDLVPLESFLLFQFYVAVYIEFGDVVKDFVS